jgi:hypothetical protein
VYSRRSRRSTCALRSFAATLLLIAFTDLLSCYAAATQARIYWSGAFTWRANIDGSEITQIFSGPAEDLVIDSRTNELYSALYVNSLGGGIFRSTLDGENLTKILSFPLDVSPLSGALSLALDNVRNHIYFVENITSTIYRVDLDGSNLTTIIPTDGLTTSLVRIEKARIDPNAEKLYWSYGKKTFFRSNLDGSGIESLFSSQEYLQDFEIDSRNEKIYWNSSEWGRDGGSVHRANFDGSELETLVSDGLWGAYGLALDLARGKIYFSDGWTSGPVNYDGTIRVANLDGSMIDTKINLGPNYNAQPWRGLAIDTRIVPEPSIFALFTIATCCYLAFIRGHRRCKLDPRY